MIDVDREIAGVSRSVGNRTVDGVACAVVSMSRAYPAPVADVWDACTNPERIPRWFLPVTAEPRVGGRFQFEGNAGGTIQSCEAPESLRATWEYGKQVSWIELTFAPDPSGTGTRFTLEHIAPFDQHWTDFGPGATGVGWDGGLVGLGRHLETGETVTGGEDWSQTDDGRRFMRLSSERWGDAHEASGVDPAEARALAKRTGDFYTGEES